MKQTLTTKVYRITHTEESRTASLKVVNARVGMFQDITLDIPIEQPLHPGDTVTLTVEWPV